MTQVKVINKSQLLIAKKVLQAIRDNCEIELKKSLTKENKKNCDKVKLFQLTDELLKQDIWRVE